MFDRFDTADLLNAFSANDADLAEMLDSAADLLAAGLNPIDNLPLRPLQEAACAIVRCAELAIALDERMPA